MTTNRHASGRAAREIGADWEAFVEQHHGEALRMGIVAGPVEHNEPHWKLMDGEWRTVAAGVADYTGILYNKVATTLGVEAKCRRGRLRKDEITPKQQHYLEAVVRGGGLALLLVRLTGANWVFNAAIPWQSVPWRIKTSAESLGREDISSEYVISPDCRCYLERFCPVRGIPAQGIAGGQQRRFPRE